MSNEQHKQLIRRWWEAMNNGNAREVIAEVYADDYVLHDPSQPEPVRGTAGVHEFVGAVLTGFPDGRYTIEDLIVEGDKVVQRISARATHRGEYLGIPPTGNAVSVWLMIISRIANGKIVEEWQLVDALTLMQQLGVIPTPS